MLNFLPQVRNYGLLVESGHRGRLVHVAHLTAGKLAVNCIRTCSELYRYSRKHCYTNTKKNTVVLQLPL